MTKRAGASWGMKGEWMKKNCKKNMRSEKSSETKPNEVRWSRTRFERGIFFLHSGWSRILLFISTCIKLSWCKPSRIWQQRIWHYMWLEVTLLWADHKLSVRSSTPFTLSDMNFSCEATVALATAIGWLYHQVCRKESCTWPIVVIMAMSRPSPNNHVNQLSGGWR